MNGKWSNEKSPVAWRNMYVFYTDQHLENNLLHLGMWEIVVFVISQSRTNLSFHTNNGLYNCVCNVKVLS